LKLNENSITDEGRRLVEKALFDSTSKEAILTSNHDCMVSMYDNEYRDLISFEVALINGGESYNRAMKQKSKVVVALCQAGGEQFDLGFFNDIPLELMPRVLRLVQYHSLCRLDQLNRMQLDTEKLSRLFHNLRWWKLPLLFQNLARPKILSRKRRKIRS